MRMRSGMESVAGVGLSSLQGGKAPTRLLIINKGV
jgi:hypothetical protein